MKMYSKLALQWSIFSAALTLSCVCTTTTHNQYLLEFIAQDHASAGAMKYGFLLLEDIRLIRMTCEERRDELERQFTQEISNWMKYAQQTEQSMSHPKFEQYMSQSKESVELTIQQTYKELFFSRLRRLHVIQRQCDDKLEELLQERKISMLGLVADLMNKNADRLKELVGELVSYKVQLEEGYQDCVERQTLHYKSRISSKLLSPEDHCSGPDIDILTAFLNRMLTIINEEQTSFFGDDEDLVGNTPCGMSGCGQTDGFPDIIHSHDDEMHTTTEPHSETPTTHSTTHPTTNPTRPVTRPTRPPPSPSSHELPTRPTRPHTHDDSTQSATDTTQQPISETKQPTTEAETRPTATMKEIIDISPDTKPPVTVPETHATTPESETKPSSGPETMPPAATTPTEEKTTQPLPAWAENAINKVLRNKPQKQQAEAEVPVEHHTGTGEHTEQEEDSRSHHHGHDDHGYEGHDDEDDRDSSRGDGDSRTGNRHGGHGGHNGHDGSQEVVINIPQSGQTSPDDSTSSHIYRPLIYSFATVGGVLVVMTLVLVVAILIVQRKRRQLLAAQLLTQEQKIAIMKQTGYVNPTYKFFDKQNDG